MNILVTGGAGYIGSHTVVELMNAGHHPIIVDDLSNARWDVRNRIGEITGRVPAFYEIDCADKVELQKVFKDYKIDSVRGYFLTAVSRTTASEMARPCVYPHVAGQWIAAFAPGQGCGPVMEDIEQAFPPR